ncbi:adenylate kinase isoenzyme 5-like [Ostrinia furnacalis]|uniref:adenylate kinase isoenzyme 5-like n=1 Tax=Ostrinia furnacalis TaxID=93504 RepID=UPI00103AA1D7|nr:adenylate kinase isoenzyme 5-like [Ostrinia furnacalis]
MGICLDTEQNNDELETTSGDRSRRESAWAGRATPPAASFPMQNSSHVKFEPPNVPVIFVLGGPGSGKVTHCDNLMQERRGVVHINMTDLLQQYAIGNDMQDFGTLSSKTVTEVLMLEMKMAPTAKTYLVSGYPRSMRDVAEYSDKIQTISGVVLVSWRQRVLERQIEYGARLGHVVLSLARMELNNFYKNVMPVADYFDQSNMLIAVNGERNPEEVYKDFRAAVLQILGTHEDQAALNGVGTGGIPGEIVGVEPAPTARRPSTPVRVEDTEDEAFALPIAAPVVTPPRENGRPAIIVPKSQLITVQGFLNSHQPQPPVGAPPPVLWVVGGPGSNKATLCQRVVARRQGWTHFSLGQHLRALADAGGGPASDGALARASLSGGELVPEELVNKVVRGAMNEASRNDQGLVLEGYPRDMEQVDHFQKEFRISPRMLLLDCSKLQLGRGRRDDSVAAFRRRLEVFREHSLPMLRALDQMHRLVIVSRQSVDGDSDAAEVQTEFSRIMLEELEKAEAIAAMPPTPQPPSSQPPTPPRADVSAIQQFAHAVSRMGGGLANGFANGTVRNGTVRNGTVPNGSLPNGTMANGIAGVVNNKVKPITNNVSKIPTVSQMTQDEVRRLYEGSSGDIATHM